MKRRIEKRAITIAKVQLGCNDNLDYWRPKTRAECPDLPCPFVACRYHLMLDLDFHGNIIFNYEDITEMKYTCTFEFIEKMSSVNGAMYSRNYTLNQISEVMKVTRERIRQIEALALSKLKKKEGYYDLL